MPPASLPRQNLWALRVMQVLYITQLHQRHQHWVVDRGLRWVVLGRVGSGETSGFRLRQEKNHTRPTKSTHVPKDRADQVSAAGSRWKPTHWTAQQLCTFGTHHRAQFFPTARDVGVVSPQDIASDLRTSGSVRTRLPASARGKPSKHQRPGSHWRGAKGSETRRRI